MRISVCIPTYNRAVELVDLLDSIVQQRDFGFDLEVVVSDNASEDGTYDVVQRYRDRIPGLVYSATSSNIGADRNFLRSVELASGDYCWLIGSDDKYEPGAFARIGAILDKYGADLRLSGVSVAARGYGPDLREVSQASDPLIEKLRDVTFMEDKDRILSTVGVGFGFLSSLVVNRSRWNHVVATYPVSDHFNVYVHVYVVANIIDVYPRWVCVPERLVGYRGGNDSFLGNGRFNRMRIDVMGYLSVFRSVLEPHEYSYRVIVDELLRLHVYNHVKTAKLASEGSAFWKQAFGLLMPRFRGHPAFWWKVMPVMLTPAPVIRGAYRLVRMVRDRQGRDGPDVVAERAGDQG